MPWELAAAPWGYLIVEVQKELARLDARARAGSRVLRTLRKLHREWPRDARRRVLLVEDMLKEWESTAR
jgi:hypothetical protein